MERGRTGKNILIVEDHVLFAEMLAVLLARALRSPGAPEKPGNFPKFSYATSIAEALRLVPRDRPLDLAVVDLILPDGNGTTVVRELKRRQSWHTGGRAYRQPGSLRGTRSGGR